MLCHVGLYRSHHRSCQHRHCARVIPRRPSLSSHHCAAPRRRVSVALSIAVTPRSPSPSSRQRAFHRLPLPLCSRSSIAVELTPSLAVEEPSRPPSPSRSRRAVPCHRGAVTPSIVVEELSRHPSPSRSRRPCRQAALTVAGIITNIRHSSRPSQALCPAGCRVASPHAAASHLPAPLIAASPLVLFVHPAGCPVSLLFTLPPPICRRLLLSSRRRLLSRPSRASRSAG